MKNILFTQMYCPVRASLCTHLGSAPMVNIWFGCSVQAVVLIMQRKSLCVTNGTCSRYVDCYFTIEMFFLWMFRCLVSFLALNALHTCRTNGEVSSLLVWNIFLQTTVMYYEG